MNSSKMMTRLMKSNMPQNMMKTFGFRKTKKSSMMLSVIGLVASAAAAYTLRNKTGRAKEYLQNMHISDKMQSALQRPLTAGVTEFAKEFAAEMNGMMMSARTESKRANISHDHSDRHLSPSPASATSPISNELINQIGSAANINGDDQQLEVLATKLIESNLNTH